MAANDRRVPRGRDIRVIVGGQRAVVRDGDRVVEPLLENEKSDSGSSSRARLGATTYAWKATTHGLVLQGRLTDVKRIVLGLGRNRRGCGEVVRVPAVTAAAAIAFVIVSFVKTLQGWLGRERQGRDIRS